VDADRPAATSTPGGGEAVAERFPHLSIAALGLITIVSYGAAFYAFGVLLGPIVDDTGWSEALIAGSFSIATLLGAFGAGVAGRLADEYGARRIMLLGGAGGALALSAAGLVPNVWLFLLAFGIGAGVLAATGFYHMTQAAAARLATSDPARGIMLLTLYGAFAGPIYLPLTGVLVEATNWRTSIVVLGLSAGIGMVASTLLLRDGPRVEVGGQPTSVRAALRDPRARSLLAATLIGGIAVSVMLVYQVPLMVSAGLSLSAAATVSGVRGFAQFGGRLAMVPLLPLVGARRSLVLSYFFAAAAAILLGFSGTVPVALVYVVVAGIAVGVVAPVGGVYAHEVFPPDRVATLMGTQRMFGGLGGAIGPLAAGILAESAGARGPVLAVAFFCASAAGVVLLLGHARREG
jgi:MFS family permease